MCLDINGFSQKQLRKINRKSRAAAKRLSGWEPPPKAAPSSEGELKGDIASVLARAILQRRALSRQSIEGEGGDDDDASAWE